ncbi:ABC transporter permease [Clostridium sp. JNZ X4-2]
MIGNKNAVFKILLYILAFICLFPIIILIISAFSGNWQWPYFVPRQFSLRGIKYVLSSSNNSLEVLIYSVILSMTVTLVTIVISIPAGRALGIYHFKGKNIVKLLVLAPVIVPPVSVGLGIHVEFLKFGIANSFLGVVIIHLIPCIPYAVSIISDVFKMLGEQLEQQARVLGATGIQTFFHVTLPTIMPAVISSAFLVFIVSFSQYFLTFLIGGGKVVTYSILMFPFIEGGDKNIAAGFSLIFIITSLIVLFVIEKVLRSHYEMEDYFYI